MKIIIICSTGIGSGALIRGKYIEKALRNNGIETEFIKSHKRLKFNLDYFLYLPINIFKILFKKADYVLVLKPFPGAFIPALFHRFIRRSKIIIDIDDLDHSYRKGITAKVIEFIQKRLSKKSDLITVLDNKDLINYLELNWNLKNMITFEQGVDLELFKPSNKRGSKEKIICFTGQMGYTAPEIYDIIKIFSDIVKENNVKLLMVGGGSRLDDAKKLVDELGIDDKVIFTGKVKNTEVPRYINSADICVCYYGNRICNLYRNSMKIREYLAMNKLVVCTNIGDLKKFAKYTIQTDTNSFKEGLLKALKSKEKINSRELIEREFNWDNIVRNLIKHL